MAFFDDKENQPLDGPMKPNLSPRKYYLAEALGEGAFGAVRTVYDDDGASYAMKTFGDEEEEEEIDDDESSCHGLEGTLDPGAIREISVLRLLGEHHPNIMTCCDVAEVRGIDGLCMMMPKLACSLDSAITGGALKNTQKLTVAHRLLGAVAFLHANNIMHRDIKCPNILLNDDMEPILADFSLAKLCATATGLTHTPDTGTAGYRAPEAMGGEYGFSSDMYSVGIVLLELFQGMLTIEREAAIRKHVQEVRSKLSDKPMPALLKGLLSENPEERPTAEESLSMPLFSKITIDTTGDFRKVHDKLIEALPPGKKTAKSKFGIERETRKTAAALGFSNPLTWKAAAQYAAASGRSPVYCTVLAGKLYEEDLLSMNEVEETIDIDIDEYFVHERQIFALMGYCLYI